MITAPELYYTSFFILIPSFIARHLWYGQLYNVMLGLSVLNHSKRNDVYSGKEFVRFLDRCVAHVLGCGLFLRALRLSIERGVLNNWRLLTFWMCLLYVVIEYHGMRILLARRSASANAQKWLHTSFHVVACLGGCLLAY